MRCVRTFTIAMLAAAVVASAQSSGGQPPPTSRAPVDEQPAAQRPASRPFNLDTNLLALADAAGTGRNARDLSLSDLLPAKIDLARELRLAAWSDPVDRIPFHLEEAGLFGPPPPAGAGWPGRIGITVPLMPVIDKNGHVRYTVLTPWSESWSDLKTADKVGVVVQDMVAIGTLVMLLRGIH